METKDRIRDAIAAEAVKRGLSAHALSKLAEMDPATVKRYLDCKSVVSAAGASKLLAALDIVLTTATTTTTTTTVDPRDDVWNGEIVALAAISPVDLKDWAIKRVRAYFYSGLLAEAELQKALGMAVGKHRRCHTVSSTIPSKVTPES